MIAENGGLILQISKDGDRDSEYKWRKKDSKSRSPSPANVGWSPSVESHSKESSSPSSVFTVSVEVSTLNVSLIVELPIRRELLSLVMDGLETTIRYQGQKTSFEFQMLDIQLDNYSETAIHPAILRSERQSSLAEKISSSSKVILSYV